MKKLLPALCMLLVSAILMGTSTYAWFSMNTQVSATGMQINVKSNNTFLLINTGDNDTAAEIQTAKVTTIPVATISAAEAQVYPSSPILDDYLAADGAAINNATHKYFTYGTDVVEDAATAAVAANWFTAQNNDPASANNTVKNVNTLNTTANDTYEFSNYVVKRTVYLTLAVGAETAHNLTVTPIKFQAATGQSATDYTGVKVLVATGDNSVILDSSMLNSAQSLHAIDFDITDQAVVTVDIYLYYDGEESAVNTNNIADLAAADIDLAFNVEVGSAS